MLRNIPVNTENMSAVADYIETLPQKNFLMSTWIAPSDPKASPSDPGLNDPCDTVACIAGWTVRLLRPWELYRMTSYNEIQAMAAFLLGLDMEMADRLFMAKDHPWEESYYYMTGQDAARTLRHLANTAQLSWEFLLDHDCSQCAKSSTNLEQDENDLPF